CFYVQAEDGIRDRNVTGVQTCALPICRMVELTGVPVPPELLAHLESAPDAEETYRRGLHASVELLQAVLGAGAPGVHLYTFNSEIGRASCRARVQRSAAAGAVKAGSRV